jgi:TolA-binding protein
MIRNICNDCESTDNWPRFKQLLDALFAEAKPVYQWSLFLESCFDNKTATLAKKYHDYRDNNHAYALDRDRTFAKRHIASEEYEEAAQLYLSILDRCGPADDRALFEFELYECMFLNGKYRDVIPRLESYIAGNKAINQARVEEAMLMKARAHAKLGQIEQAVESCSAVVQHPGTKQSPEAGLFMGSCCMLQGKPKESREVFEGVVRDYPQSSWANKARLCLARLKDMADEKTAKQD